jgi:hypothetical protein
VEFSKPAKGASPTSHPGRASGPDNPDPPNHRAWAMGLLMKCGASLPQAGPVHATSYGPREAAGGGLTHLGVSGAYGVSSWSTRICHESHRVPRKFRPQ